MKFLNRRPGWRLMAGAAAAVACCAAVVPAVAEASSAAPAAPQVAQCTGGNTYVWLALAPNGAAGTIYYPIEFTNLGAHACWLYGYPGVSAVTSKGGRVGPPAGRFGQPPKPHKVTLGHNQTAHALLGIIENGIIGGCHAATGGGLSVYPPGQTEKQGIFNFTFPVCKNKVYMHVYPVQAGIGVP